MSDTEVDEFPSLDSLMESVEFAGADTVAPDEEPAIDPVTGKKPRKKRSDAGQARGPRGSTGPRKARGGLSAADKKLADELLNPIAKIVKGLTFVAPTVAGVLANRGEASAQGVVALASPKMKEALGKAAKTGPGLDLIETLLMMIVAAAVDFGRMDPDSPVAALLGVRNIYHEMHPETETPSAAQETEPAPNGFPFPAPPMGFAPFPGAVA
jgi:hypothetical protein